MADFSFSVTGNSLLRYMAVSGAFKDFFTDREPDFYVDSCLDEAEVLQSASYRERKVCYEISFEGIDCSFGKAGDMLYFDMISPEKDSVLVLLCRPGDTTVRATDGKYSPSMCRFGLWMALNILCIPRKCAAVHSSVNVCGGQAAMFLGESGTGKSTHTRLLRERYPDVPSYPAANGRVKVPAGWLIERCGFKGKTHGQVGVYEKQALVLVNLGDARGYEIALFAESIREAVRDRFGIELMPEVKYVG